MAYLYGSGNETVDRMTNFGITGNVIPHAWYRTIAKDNGRPHLLAIELLADIVYWYRPQEIRDEHTGHLLRYQKKFSGDMLQKSYDQYAAFFGEKKRIIKEAMDVLVKLGVIKRLLRTVETDSMKLPNIMFLDLDVDKLFALTYPEEVPVVDNLSTENRRNEKTDENPVESYPPVDNLKVPEAAENKDFTIKMKEADPMVRKNVPYPTKKRTISPEKAYHILRKNVPYGTENRNTYTDSTTENTKEITTEMTSPHHQYLLTHTREQLAKHLEQKLREQIGYETLSREFTYAGRALDEAVKKIAEAMASEKDPVVIDGKSYPYSLANMRFENATEHTFRSAIENIRVGIDRKDTMVIKLFSAPLHFASK